MYKLYTEYAELWPVFSRVEDYAEEAEGFASLLLNALDRDGTGAKTVADSEDPRGGPPTLLELGCGGGHNASFLKRSFACTLTDLSGEMLSVSRRLNPELEHVQGDMRELRLGRTFDAVFVHDAVMYMTEEDDLTAMFDTAATHCRPGGVVLVAPDCFAETFEPGTSHGGHDLPDGESAGSTGAAPVAIGGHDLRDGVSARDTGTSPVGIRYLEWTHPPDRGRSAFRVDFAYLVGMSDGEVLHDFESQEFGLFAKRRWIEIAAATGFDASIERFEHAEMSERGYEVLLGRRRA